MTYFGSRVNDKDVLYDVELGVQNDLSSCNKGKFVPYVALHYFITDEKGALKDKNNGYIASNEGVFLLTGLQSSF